ncbi:class I SAM-dependent methyltransferase [Prosthecomicrobium sp. N25]|uniref:class I SAM-dependent methyltransferase n=1 Tax=Prosthecomicrobium sp. N25 TaxID=3129254 RepID=UPI0030787C91
MAEDWRDVCFDLTRGIAAYTGNALVRDLARTVGRHPQVRIGTAFNRKQVASKLWARDSLLATLGGRFGTILIVGGWYGVLAAMLFDDPRFEVERIESLDIDPEVAAVATTLNGRAGDRFSARTGDMYAADYQSAPADLVVNTSCEHIADLRGWLDLLPSGSRVLLQSNDYFREPTHIASVPSLADFQALAGLSEVRFAGALPTRNYTRFMLIGTT